MQVTLELSRLDRIDNAGIGVVISLYKRARNYGGMVRLVGVKDQPRAIFKLLRLDRVFPV